MRRWVVAFVGALVLVGGTGAAVAVAVAVEPSTLEVRRLTVHADRDLGSQFGGRVGVTVRFRVVNTGTAIIEPVARIELESQIGGGTTSAPIALPALEPGEHVDVARTAGSLLPFGSVHATVTVRADGAVARASASTPVVPWYLLVIVVGALAFAYAVLAERRRASPRAREVVEVVEVGEALRPDTPVPTAAPSCRISGESVRR